MRPRSSRPRVLLLGWLGPLFVLLTFVLPQPLLAAGAQAAITTTSIAARAGALSRPHAVTDGNGNTTTYAYDPFDHVSQIAQPDSSTVNELTSLTEPGGAQTTFGYDAIHNRTVTNFPDSVSVTNSYDPSQRLAGITARNSSTTLVGLTYSYASGGTDTALLQTVQENDAPGVGPYPTRNFTTTYGYDPRNLVQSWVLHNNATNATIHAYQYQYDANGNRTQIVADPYNSQGQIVPSPGQGVAHSNETDLAYTPVNELLTTAAYSKQGATIGTANWTYDQAGNLTGNSGYPGVSSPLQITYNQHNQTTGISDVYGTLVPMTYAGAGQGERLSAGWSNQPNPTDPTKPPEYGSTAYTYSALGLMSTTDTTGTTSFTRDPSGLPISERTPNGTYYYVLDGLGNAVMLVDPPSGAPAWIGDICPTGNAAGEAGRARPSAAGTWATRISCASPPTIPAAATTPAPTTSTPCGAIGAPTTIKSGEEIAAGEPPLLGARGVASLG
jgi:YD repeat-containing protein